MSESDSTNKPRAVLRQRWYAAATPVYEHLYARVGRALSFAGGVLILDGIRLALVSLEGSIVWQREFSGGVWGHPRALGEGHVACADLINGVHVIDTRGQLVRSMKLPASPNTELLGGERGELYVGVGSLVCDLICVGPDGQLVWQTTVDNDDGLVLPLTFGPDRGIWVPMERGLLLVARDTGREMVHVQGAEPLSCISEALPWERGALVAVSRRSERCSLLHVSSAGRILGETPLPSLQRARLLAAPDGGAWLLGSTAWKQDSVRESDHVYALAIGRDGKVRAQARLPGDRSLDGTMDPGGGVWLGTYTAGEDGTERGTLYCVDPEGAEVLRWSPGPPAGVGAPLLGLGPDQTVYVPTSTGLSCMEMAWNAPKSAR